MTGVSKESLQDHSTSLSFRSLILTSQPLSMQSAATSTQRASRSSRYGSLIPKSKGLRRQRFMSKKNNRIELKTRPFGHFTLESEIGISPEHVNKERGQRQTGDRESGHLNYPTSSYSHFVSLFFSRLHLQINRSISRLTISILLKSRGFITENAFSNMAVCG